MWEDEEEIDYGEYKVSIKERLRQRRIRKRMMQGNKPERGIVGFVAMRAVELLAPELILSLVISLMIKNEIIPSTLIVALIVLGVTLFAYIIYAAITSHHLFWALADAKKYLAVNLGGYAAVIVVTVIARSIDIRVFSWMFLPTKLFTLFSYSSWVSLLIVHLVMLFIIFIMLVNVKSRAYFELTHIDDEEE